MTSPNNPYQPPSDIDRETDRETQMVAEDPTYLDPGDSAMLGVWPVVLLLNTVLPGFLAVQMCNRSGMIGIGISVMMFLVTGFWICFKFPRVGRGLVIGAGAMSLTQLFPVLHFLFGLLALGFAEAVGLIDTVDFDEGPADVSTVLAGFVITTLVGGALAVTGLAVGLVLNWLFRSKAAESRGGFHTAPR